MLAGSTDHAGRSEPPARMRFAVDATVRRLGRDRYAPEQETHGHTQSMTLGPRRNNCSTEHTAGKIGAGIRYDKLWARVDLDRHTAQLARPVSDSMSGDTIFSDRQL